MRKTLILLAALAALAVAGTASTALASGGKSPTPAAADDHGRGGNHSEPGDDKGVDAAPAAAKAAKAAKAKKAKKARRKHHRAAEHPASHR